jgi:hypothetical protein
MRSDRDRGGDKGRGENKENAAIMDAHLRRVTPEALLEAHNADLAIQDRESVNFVRSWADPQTGMACACPRPKRRGSSASSHRGDARTV